MGGIGQIYGFSDTPILDWIKKFLGKSRLIKREQKIDEDLVLITSVKNPKDGLFLACVTNTDFHTKLCSTMPERWGFYTELKGKIAFAIPGNLVTQVSIRGINKYQYKNNMEKKIYKHKVLNWKAEITHNFDHTITREDGSYVGTYPLTLLLNSTDWEEVKQPDKKKDFEILAFIYKGKELIERIDVIYFAIHGEANTISEDRAIKAGHKILKVKCLITGNTWTVGDETNFGKIEKFSIEPNNNKECLVILDRGNPVYRLKGGDTFKLSELRPVKANGEKKPHIMDFNERGQFYGIDGYPRPLFYEQCNGGKKSEEPKAKEYPKVNTDLKILYLKHDEEKRAIIDGFNLLIDDKNSLKKELEVLRKEFNEKSEELKNVKAGREISRYLFNSMEDKYETEIEFLKSIIRKLK